MMEVSDDLHSVTWHFWGSAIVLIEIVTHSLYEYLK